MGHQNQAIGLRLGFNNKWTSKWSVDIKNKEIYKYLIHQDLLIKSFISQFFKTLKIQILKPIIKRNQNQTHIFIGVLNYDRLGEQIDLKIFKNLQKLLENFTNTEINLYYISLDHYLFDAEFLGNFIVNELKNNKKPLTIFKSILKTKDEINSTFADNILGIRYEVSGRIKGVDRARTLKFLWGSVPLNTFSTKFSFAKKIAYTKEGTLGVKAWITFKE